MPQNDGASGERVPPHMTGPVTLHAFDAETAALVHLAAVLAGGDEADVRDVLGMAFRAVRPDWVEEVLLQTYLFAGFPRALNGMREWRRISGRAAPEGDADGGYDVEAFRARGEVTCATVYGPMYDRLRVNIATLHPALDQWMVVEGYGKVLGRPGLDLGRRELCIIGACAVARQDRQLHSHLHGALHAGVAATVVTAALQHLRGLLRPEDADRFMALWERVQG
jgi:4-carboxymuconolactone decarboxylase